MSDWRQLKLGIYEQRRATKCSSFADFYLAGLEEIQKLEEQIAQMGIGGNLTECDRLIDQMEENLEFIPKELIKDFWENHLVLAQCGLVEWSGSYQGEIDGSPRAFSPVMFQDLLEAISPKDLKVYREMKDAGWEPHLVMTPIAKNWREVWTQLDNKVSDKIPIGGTNYEPSGYETGVGPDGKPTLVPTGSMWSKNSLIEDNRGWLIDIVPLKERMENDPDILDDIKKNKVPNAEQVVRFDKKWRSKGYNGLSVQTYTVASLLAKKRFGYQLDKSREGDENCTLLTESVSNNAEEIIMAMNYDGGQMKIHPHKASMRFKISRFRPSWRIKLKPQHEK